MDKIPRHGGRGDRDVASNDGRKGKEGRGKSSRRRGKRNYSEEDMLWSMAWYGYESVCAGASLGETISNWDSSKLGRSSYDDSPDVRGTASAPAVLRGGDATSRDGARDDVNDSVEETLGRCGFVRAAMLALTFSLPGCRGLGVVAGT